MKTTINKSDFREAFRDRGRFDQFGYEALDLLFDYLEDMEADTEEELELDVIALCCQYSVMTREEICKSYDLEYDDVDDYLADNTTVIGELSNGSILFDSEF